MTFNIDVIIVVIFLIANLGAGLYSGRGIKSIKEYAVGDRNFSTATIAATIIATWISGSFFTVSVSQSYKEGIWFIPAAVGDILSLVIIARFLAPKMNEFFGHLSVAETMGVLYGKNIRFITAISSLAQAIAMTALQIQVFSTLFSHFLNFSTTTAVLISSFVVIFYSAWGGIKSVTFTDVIQFFTFGIFIPMFALFIWQTFGNDDVIINTFKTHPLLDYTQLLNYKDARFFPNFFMMLWFLIPSLSSTTFQRTLMAKNTQQIGSSFNTAAIGYGAILLLSCGIGLLVLSINHELNPDSALIYILDNYSFTGLKGLTVIGIMAMVMSTADSWINTGAVIFSHDFCKPFGIAPKNELLISRIFTVLIGIISVILVLSTSSLFKLFSLQANFYMPIVTMPLLLAILGFRSSAKAVGIGMLSGAMCAIIWKIYITPQTAIDSVVPAMIANLIAFISAHYLLKQPGGWLKTQQAPKSTTNYLNKFIQPIKNIYDIGIIAYCNKRLPQKEIIYSYFALAVALTIIVSLTIDKDVYKAHSTVIRALQSITLFISTIFLSNKLWSQNFREKYIGPIWYLSIFIGLTFNSVFLLLLSNFSQESLVILVMNLTIVGILLPWRPTIVMIISGAVTAFYCYDFFIGIPAAIETYNATHIGYAVFIIITFLLMFEKPREEALELASEKIDHLSDRVDFQNQEIDKLTELKYEFLRNIEHEAHTPITGITNLAEMLWLDYDKISEKDKKEMTQMVALSADRLKSFISNFIDLSKLTSLTYKLILKPINLSQLLKTRFDLCIKLYIAAKDLNKQVFNLKIDDNIMISGDEYLLTRTIDNLIINSIKYCPHGKIDLVLHKNGRNIEFTITDEGIGIPADELRKVFGVMVVSSRTKTPSGGRGVGLALCKKAIELHKGDIWAEENKSGKGVTFKFVIPS